MFLIKHVCYRLGSGNLRLAVVLPEGEDLNEWLAVNSKSSQSPQSLARHPRDNRGRFIRLTRDGAAVDFFNQLNMLVSSRDHV